MKTLRKFMGFIMTIASVFTAMIAVLIMTGVIITAIIGGEIVLVLMGGEFIVTALLCVIIPIVMFRITSKVKG